MRNTFNHPSTKERRRELRRSATLGERMLWQALRQLRIRGLQVHRQVSIEQFVVDFYVPRIKLAIEVDGIMHEGAQSVAYDVWRQRIIESHGVTFYRVKDEEVIRDVGRVSDTIAAHIFMMAGITPQDATRRVRKERLPRHRSN